MSETTSTSAATAYKPIAETDQKFLNALLSNVIGGAISVNLQGVADDLNYTNVKSVANKMAKIKKDYGIPFTSGKPTSTSETGEKPVKAKAAPKTKAPAVPKVVKAPTEKKAKATAASKKRSAPVDEDEDGDDNDADTESNPPAKKARTPLPNKPTTTKKEAIKKEKAPAKAKAAPKARAPPKARLAPAKKQSWTPVNTPEKDVAETDEDASAEDDGADDDATEEVESIADKTGYRDVKQEVESSSELEELSDDADA